MPVVVIKNSSPVYNRGELLDGTLKGEILGWQHKALTVQTHVIKADLQAAMDRLAPDGYYITEHPQIVQHPPKLEMYTITSVGVKFSDEIEGFAIEREDDDTYTGAGGAGSAVT